MFREPVPQLSSAYCTIWSHPGTITHKKRIRISTDTNPNRHETKVRLLTRLGLINRQIRARRSTISWFNITTPRRLRKIPAIEGSIPLERDILIRSLIQSDMRDVGRESAGQLSERHRRNAPEEEQCQGSDLRKMKKVVYVRNTQQPRRTYEG